MSTTASRGEREGADAEHEDLTVMAFLDLLDEKIDAGRVVEELSDAVAQEMQEHVDL